MQLIVVGDDYQSIFAFRDCSPDFINNFPEWVVEGVARSHPSANPVRAAVRIAKAVPFKVDGLRAPGQ